MGKRNGFLVRLGKRSGGVSIALSSFPILSLRPVLYALLFSPQPGASGYNLLLHPPSPPINLIWFPTYDLVMLCALNASRGVAGGEKKPFHLLKRTLRANPSTLLKVSAGSCLQLCQTKCAAKCQLSLCAVTPRAAKRY